MRSRRLKPLKVVSKFLRGPKKILTVPAPTESDVQTPLVYGRNYGVDSAILVPGFGVFMHGWFLAPPRRIASLKVVLGEAILPVDPTSFVTVSRMDLVGLAGGPETVRAAGFRAVFRGGSGDLGPSRPRLEIRLDDDSEHRLDIPAEAFSRCESRRGLDRLLEMFPFFAHETYLEDFAEAFAKPVRQAAADIVVVEAPQTESVVLLTMPRNWDDLFLFLANVHRHAHAFPATVGFVFVADRNVPRDFAFARYKVLKDALGRPTGYAEVDEINYVLWSILPILTKLGAKRFWFCGPDVIPTARGWFAASAVLASEDLSVTTFGYDGGAVGFPEPESLSFAWSTEAFAQWVGSAPFYLAGFHRDNMLPPRPETRRIRAGIGIARTQITKDSLCRVDERLYRARSAARLVPA